ncbi:hypothetical protein LJ737_09810 [Hymenobacter sp. 15J16-1T3B]|uniref:hypothetical protein n=1 Tax=Hymenobacter sp. 15J16-1T3B TaxID=2886941 RepID=UPI001D1161A0|nr:hypothetical protein [Hymenobacter sp. 15J16-1T3B]MCC3157535.1 hypothetical protein [Hymenobacter sp. 15J16-1T3B]
MNSMLPTWLRRPVLPTALAAVLLLPGCGTGLFPEPEGQETPEYQISQAEQAWATPYRLGDEWRFRNAAGYERRYQVKGLADQQLPGMAAGSQRVQYYRQGLSARLERVDSGYVARPGQQQYLAQFSMKAAVPKSAEPLTVELTWGPSQLRLPAAAQPGALPADVRLLPAATLGTRQYQNVWEYTSLLTSAARVPAGAVRQVYYTKENGVVRFVEANGTVWDRQ